MGLFFAMASPILPNSPSGSPSFSVLFSQVFPASCVIKIPEPSPPELKNQGSLLCSHNATINLFGFVGSITISPTPVLLFENKTLLHVFPPSTVLKTPRSLCAPQGDPMAPTYTIFGLVGSIRIRWICRVFSNPIKSQLCPPSKER